MEPGSEIPRFEDVSKCWCVGRGRGGSASHVHVHSVISGTITTKIETNCAEEVLKAEFLKTLLFAKLIGCSDLSSMNVNMCMAQTLREEGIHQQLLVAMEYLAAIMSPYCIGLSESSVKLSTNAGATTLRKMAETTIANGRAFTCFEYNARYGVRFVGLNLMLQGRTLFCMRNQGTMRSVHNSR